MILDAFKFKINVLLYFQIWLEVALSLIITEMVLPDIQFTTTKKMKMALQITSKTFMKKERTLLMRNLCELARIPIK